MSDWSIVLINLLPYTVWHPEHKRGRVSVCDIIRIKNNQCTNVVHYFGIFDQQKQKINNERYTLLSPINTHSYCYVGILPWIMLLLFCYWCTLFYLHLFHAHAGKRSTHWPEKLIEWLKFVGHILIPNMRTSAIEWTLQGLLNYSLELQVSFKWSEN